MSWSVTFQVVEKKCARVARRRLAEPTDEQHNEAITVVHEHGVIVK